MFGAKDAKDPAQFSTSTYTVHHFLFVAPTVPTSTPKPNLVRSELMYLHADYDKPLPQPKTNKQTNTT